MAIYHRWTPEMVQFLRDHYEYVGDVLLAEEFNDRFPHMYRWHFKSIEKKRNYLGLKRTKEQETFLRWFATSFLIDPKKKKVWDTRGRAKAGEVRIWGRYEYIKAGRCFVRLAVHTWQKHHGKVPKGYNVCLKNRDITAADINNLELISDADLGLRNTVQRYPEQIRESAFLLHKLKRKINEKQDHGFKQSSIRAVRAA